MAGAERAAGASPGCSVGEERAAGPERTAGAIGGSERSERHPGANLSTGYPQVIPVDLSTGYPQLIEIKYIN